MNRDQIRGASRHLKGRAQTAIGGLAGDPARQVRGAVNQVAGGAQYAYGRARDQAEDFAEDGRHLAHEVRERADSLIDDGRHYAEAARHRVTTHGRRAVRYADANRTTTLLAFVGVAVALGWLARSSR
ncbi:CsbD family protein [Methylobacterium sp. J-088]|uniref:CsbD family protein n=1 Tax=Methylobacterium sp. J-088 TaxID=2836664 RepID=UPI001FBA2814|nr:CsbD family protein [Methylobacterium sp. J-088]MCJ2064713.1 CsbD family protein [Methylobacterium sp. J-088]